MKMRCYGRYSKKASMRAVQLQRTAIERNGAVTTVKSEFCLLLHVPWRHLANKIVTGQSLKSNDSGLVLALPAIRQ